MHNYINQYTMMGMTPSFGFIENDKIYKCKNKSKVIVFDENYKGDELEINYSYINNEPLNLNKKQWFKLTEVLSIFDKDYFQNYLNSDIKETVHKYKNQNSKNYCLIKYEIMSIDEVLDMIEKWRYSAGWKYGFQEHAGYDKTFFKKYYNENKDKLNCLFFYIDNILVGYSVIEKKYSNIINGIHEYKYLIRKCLLGYRNLCKFIDYSTFEYIYKTNNESKFLINWGASSGGVLKYKTSNWFPVYSKEFKYFWKIKK